MARRKATPAQVRARAAFAARFGGKRRATSQVKPMASKTRRAASRAAHYARRGSRALSARGLNFKTAIGGFGASVGQRYIPGGWGAPIGAVAAGVLAKNQFSVDMGMFAVGQRLANMVPLPGGAAASSGQVL